MAGVLNEVRQSGAHAPYFSMTDCDEYIERKLSSLRHCTFTVRPKKPSDLIPWAQKIEFESCK